MTDGNDITDWIKAGELAHEYERPVFFGVFIQAHCDDGCVFAVIFDKNTDSPIKGGLHATQKQIERFKELGIEVKE